MMELPAAERRVSNTNAPKGDRLMAPEQRCENVACDLAKAALAAPAAGCDADCGGGDGNGPPLSFVA